MADRKNPAHETKVTFAEDSKVLPLSNLRVPMPAVQPPRPTQAPTPPTKKP
jgi:hypothetical protein